MTPNQIKRHLRAYLPTVTDRFGSASSFSAVSASNIVTFTGTHSFRVGQSIGVTSGVMRNPIATYTDNGDGSATFTTQFDHDLTEPRLTNDEKNLVLDGIDSDWNGSQPIERIPNRRTFDVAIPSGAVSPNLTNAVLVENRSAGIVGLHTITAVTSNTFTIDVTSAPPFPDGPLGDVRVASGYRIYGAANIERAEQMYTKLFMEKYALFLIMNDIDVSKDRHSYTDALATQGRQNFGRQNLINNFSLVVFIPTSDEDSAGGKAQQEAYGSIFRDILAVTYGMRFVDVVDQSNYVTQFAGHGPGVYNTSYYTQVYDFFQPSVITFDSAMNLQPDVAFRDIMATHTILGENLTSDIDLDDEPL